MANFQNGRPLFITDFNCHVIYKTFFFLNSTPSNFISYIIFNSKVSKNVLCLSEKINLRLPVLIVFLILVAFRFKT